MNFNFRDVLTVPPEEARKEGMTVSKMQELAWAKVSETVDRLAAGDRFRLEEVQVVSVARFAGESPMIEVHMVESDDIRVNITLDPNIDSCVVIHGIESGTGKTLARRKIYAMENLSDAIGDITVRAVMDEWNAIKPW